MRNILKILLILILILCWNNLISQEIKSWDYPIKPGTEQWSDLKNNREKVTACQMPNNLIKLLSTNELLGACLNYPLLPDIFVFSNIQEGFDKFKNDFNGINEFLNRKEASEILINKYKTLNPDDYQDNWTLIEKGEFSIKFSFIEIFISQEEILKQLTLERKKELVKELLIKYTKKSNIDLFGSLSYQTLAYCLVNVLNSENLFTDLSNKEELNNLLYFKSNGGNITNLTFTNILVLSKEFINN